MSRGRRLDLAFQEEARALEAGEGPRLQELTYGTIRLRGRIDHLLDHHLHQGLEELPQPLREILRLGTYELLHMDGVPEYAAVSQAVEQGRALGGRKGAALVNAVLRAVARSGEDPALFPNGNRDPVGHLSTWGSHPRWLVERWLERWSPEEVQSLVDRHNRPPPLYLRPLRISVEEGLDRLRQDGVQAEAVEEGAGCIWVVGGGDPGALVRRVEGVVQDPAAAWVTRYAAPPAGALVADLCAAPGGKALSLAGEGAKVVAGDRSFPRLRLVQEGARRLGLPVWPVVALAEAPPVARADLVLVDVPCSGTGTLARHPDARWRLTWKDVASLVRVQDRILDGAVQAVPPRGLLVYSTCTMEVEENEERARAFLSRYPEFRPEPGSGVPERYLTREGFLRILPHETGFDGAFAARFRRVGSE